jgi:2-hydroxychromene-2-carboxylate isomerase
MAAEAAAYRHGVRAGEEFSFAVRHALFEDGLDVSDGRVLQALLEQQGVDGPSDDDRRAVHDDLADGQRRGVAGSPHFFTADGSFFCPSLDIEHDGDGYAVSFDAEGFQEFVSAVFA